MGVREVLPMSTTHILTLAFGMFWLGLVVGLLLFPWVFRLK
jgi:hypothetical protein